jgi:ubiquinone/menaquinone biosynthesis C-methylase UbiE
MNNIELLEGTAQIFPRRIEKVDVILSCAVVQYLALSDFDAHFRECQRVLDGAGIVCVAMVPDAASKWAYYRARMIPRRPQHVAASLRRELQFVRSWVSWVKNFVKQDPLWDGIGNWFSRAEIEAAAERSGFDCEFVNSWYYDYRFHALMALKSETLGASE